MEKETEKLEQPRKKGVSLERFTSGKKVLRFTPGLIEQWITRMSARQQRAWDVIILDEVPEFVGRNKALLVELAYVALRPEGTLLVSKAYQVAAPKRLVFSDAVVTGYFAVTREK